MTSIRKIRRERAKSFARTLCKRQKDRASFRALVDALAGMSAVGEALEKHLNEFYAKPQEACP